MEENGVNKDGVLITLNINFIQVNTIMITFERRSLQLGICS